MASILLPIKRRYCDLILSGVKTVEYRKSRPVKEVNRIYIYESRGCGMVVGECEVAEIISTGIDELWEQTHPAGGVEKDDFDAYFHSRTEGIAYVLRNVVRYDRPLPLNHFGLTRAPQNYCWIKE